MRYLTFLDFTTLENTGKNIEAKLARKDREIEELRQEVLEMRESNQEIVDLLKNPSALLKMIQEE